MIPYNDCNIENNCYISLDSEINDNSDIAERLIPDQFTRRTITFTLSDTYLYDYKILKNWKIDTGVDIEVKFDEEIEAKDSIDIK